MIIKFSNGFLLQYNGPVFHLRQVHVLHMYPLKTSIQLLFNQQINAALRQVQLMSIVSINSSYPRRRPAPMPWTTHHDFRPPTASTCQFLPPLEYGLGVLSRIVTVSLTVLLWSNYAKRTLRVSLFRGCCRDSLSCLCVRSESGTRSSTFTLAYWFCVWSEVDPKVYSGAGLGLGF